MINVVHVTSAVFTAEILKSELPVVVELHAGTCEKCEMLERIASRLAEDFSDQVKFAELNVEEAPELSDFFDADTFPALALVDHARSKGQYLGELNEDEIRSHLSKWLATNKTSTDESLD